MSCNWHNIGTVLLFTGKSICVMISMLKVAPKTKYSSSRI